MKFFIDIVNVNEIREVYLWGIICGVIINFFLIVKEGRDFKEVVNEICFIVDGLIFVEVIFFKVEGMIEEVRDLVKIYKNIVIKILMIVEGFKVVLVFLKEGIKINVIFIFLVV